MPCNLCCTVLEDEDHCACVCHVENAAQKFVEHIKASKARVVELETAIRRWADMNKHTHRKICTCSSCSLIRLVYPPTPKTSE